MPPDPRAKVTPEDIVGNILDEMHGSLVPGWFTDFVPNVFGIYLHREDFEGLRGLQSRIREQAGRALDQELDKLNRPTRVLPFLPAAPKKRYEPLGSWVIEFFENSDDDAGSNRLIVKATAPAPPPDALEGPATVRVNAPAETAADGSQTRRSSYAPPAPPDTAPLARLVYEDDSGRQTYDMTKDLIKVGRGGALEWVDIKLLTKLDVSREHCQIRHDETTGKFFVKDLSKLGTWVNGKQVPPSVVEENGQVQDRNIEVEIPAKARLNLASVIAMDFKKLR